MKMIQGYGEDSLSEEENENGQNPEEADFVQKSNKVDMVENL